MRRAGEFDFTPEQLEKMDADYDAVEAENTYPIWADNWPVIEVFLACQTQWRVAGMTGIKTGLDYTAVDSVIRMMGKSDTAADLFADIRVMEYEALSVFADRAKQQQQQQKHGRK